MSVKCLLMILADSEKIEPVKVAAELETLPRIGDKVFLDDITNPGRGEEREFGVSLVETYDVTEIIHNTAIGRGDQGELYAIPKPDYPPYTIWLEPEKPREK